MSEIRKFFGTLIDELRQERSEIERFVRSDVDELRTDVRHLWTRLEDQWQSLQTHNAKIQSLAGDAASDISEGMVQLAEELREDYRRLREALAISRSSSHSDDSHGSG